MRDLPCGRPRAHHPHTYVQTPGDDQDLHCDGQPRSATTLAELLDRRPELVDLTAVAVHNRIQVMCA
jgi:hypothetical protein